MIAADPGRRHNTPDNKIMKTHREKDNLILIGMPASGKSTAGVILAKLLGDDFIDTDLLIQRREGQRLCEIIEARGIDGFLAAEEAACLSLEAHQSVIATGGSAVYSPAAMAHLKSLGCVMWLDVDYDALIERLHDIQGRGVVLREGQTLAALYGERCALYREYADIILPEGGRTLEETVRAASELYGEWLGKAAKA